MAEPAPGTNPWLVRRLRELAAHLELEGVLYKPRAYRRAAEGIESLGVPVAKLRERGGPRELETIPGVGSHIARTLCELLDKGTARLLETQRRKHPVDVLDLLAVEGVGPRTLKRLWEELGIRDVDQLERALEAGEVRGLSGFGARREERLRQAVRIHRGGRRRWPLQRARTLARRLARALAKHPQVQRCEIAGSIRRQRASVGDIDLLVASDAPAEVAVFFASLPEVEHVYGRGETRVSVRLRAGIDADLRIVPAASYGAALLYFTGSREHSVNLRRLALAQGLRLNEYGLFRDGERLAGETEEEIYAALGLPMVEPRRRTGQDEIRKALRGGARARRKRAR